jgi:hypothetical protein
MYQFNIKITLSAAIAGVANKIDIKTTIALIMILPSCLVRVWFQLGMAGR